MVRSRRKSCATTRRRLSEQVLRCKPRLVTGVAQHASESVLSCCVRVRRGGRPSVSPSFFARTTKDSGRRDQHHPPRQGACMRPSRIHGALITKDRRLPHDGKLPRKACRFPPVSRACAPEKNPASTCCTGGGPELKRESGHVRLSQPDAREGAQRRRGRPRGSFQLEERGSTRLCGSSSSANIGRVSGPLMSITGSRGS